MLEDKISINLMKLNQDYLDIVNSKNYKKKSFTSHRHLNLGDLLREIRYGYFFNRIKKIIFSKKSNKDFSKYNFSKQNSDISSKIAVYTVNTGNYDTNLYEPMYINPICDFFIITDNDIPKESIWKKISINSIPGIKDMTNLEKARYVKLHPHLIFDKYDYSLFIDGNIEIIADILPIFTELGDNSFATHIHPFDNCLYSEANTILALNKANVSQVKKQIFNYKKNGFPKNYGLFETNILARKHNDPKCITLMNEWWNQMCKYTMRDQLSLTYCLWKLDYGLEFVKVLGINPRINPRFRYHNHFR